MVNPRPVETSKPVYCSYTFPWYYIANSLFETTVQHKSMVPCSPLVSLAMMAIISMFHIINPDIRKTVLPRFLSVRPPQLPPSLSAPLPYILASPTLLPIVGWLQSEFEAWKWKLRCIWPWAECLRLSSLVPYRTHPPRINSVFLRMHICEKSSTLAAWDHISSQSSLMQIRWG